jgi:hypothetical protein
MGILNTADLKFFLFCLLKRLSSKPQRWSFRNTSRATERWKQLEFGKNFKSKIPSILQLCQLRKRKEAEKASGGQLSFCQSLYSPK